MFLIYATLLLFSFNFGCEAAPTTVTANATMLSSLLTDLANGCKNTFLSTQIKSKIEDCAMLVPPYHEKQFECLLFYDINKQLCDAVESAKLDISADYTTHFLEVQDVSQLCNSTKDWTFTDLGAVYKKAVTVMFQDAAKCAKVCGADSDDLLNIDSTFYCKYFKWGIDILKPHAKVTFTTTNTANAPVNTASANIADVEKPVIHNKIPELSTIVENAKPAETKIDTNITDTNTSVKTVPSVENSVTASQSMSVKSVPDLVASTNDLEKSALNSVKDEVKAHHAPEIVSQANNVGSDKKIQDGNIKKSEENTESKLNNMSKNVLDVAKKSDALEPNKNIIGNGLLNQLENPKPKDNADTDDYQINDLDSEEVRDGLSDTQGDDDGDDPSLTDLEAKVNQDIHKKPVKNNEVLVDNNDISQKEIYQNTLPEPLGSGDDRFFPFFLTAIIMVVLLYVLYHNKSKVSKVVLGLIVEGRQTGRRRNSRGHAYRRLDTLEQAMSTNIATPPSKIIY